MPGEIEELSSQETRQRKGAHCDRRSGQLRIGHGSKVRGGICLRIRQAGELAPEKSEAQRSEKEHGIVQGDNGMSHAAAMSATLTKGTARRGG